MVDVGFPGTCWLMKPDGQRLDSTVNQHDLAPWLSRVNSNEDFFYDGSKRVIAEVSDSGGVVNDMSEPNGTLGPMGSNGNQLERRRRV